MIAPTVPFEAASLESSAAGASSNQSALIRVNSLSDSDTSASAKIALTGQAGSHAPQSMHSSGLM